MAIKLDYEIMSGVIVDGAYVTVGEVNHNLFDQTCTIVLYFWRSEDGRRQVADIPDRDKVIFKRESFTVPIELYPQFMQEAAKNSAAAAYKFALEVPYPHGRKELLSDGEAV